MSRLVALSLNHKNAPVALRERVAFADVRVGEALQGLRAVPGVREAALLSTCNRTEIYALSDGDPAAIGDWLATSADADGTPLPIRDYLYVHEDAEAARHLFRVATGLDSRDRGEPQTRGRVKRAGGAPRDAGPRATRLDRLFQHAFVTAKRARTDTRIGANPVSVASAAVRLAEESFARPADCTVLLIGAGETVELASRHLVQARAKRLLFANRTLAHAQELASRHGGVALPLTELDRHLAEADIVLSATASRQPILHKGDVADALRLRRHRPMLMLDLAVPRDIAPDVAELEDAFLYGVDDLEQVIEDNRNRRREAADAAEGIVELQVARYLEALHASAHQAPLRQLRAHGEAARDASLARARQMLAAGHAPEAVLEQLAHTLTNRLLHAPTVALRDAAANGEADIVRAVERLFRQTHTAGDVPAHTALADAVDRGLHTAPTDTPPDDPDAPSQA